MAAFKEIHAGVTKVLVQALGVDEDQVTKSATLQGDLGAESIDFLDIMFRLEREFEIKIPRGELFPDSIFGADSDFVRDGMVTDQGMIELHSRMPYLDLMEFAHDRRYSSLGNIFTVGLLYRYVEFKLGQAGHDVSMTVRHSLVAGG